MTEWHVIDESTPRDRTILVYGQPSNLVIDGNELVTFKKPLACTAMWDEIDGMFCLTGGSWLGPFIEPTHYALVEPPE